VVLHNAGMERQRGGSGTASSGTVSFLPYAITLYGEISIRSHALMLRAAVPVRTVREDRVPGGTQAVSSHGNGCAVS
jgi:hypothetical protein